LSSAYAQKRCPAYRSSSAAARWVHASRAAQLTRPAPPLSSASRFLSSPRGAGGKPPQSRLSELDTLIVPTLVVQGERDPFGIPPPARARRVVKVPGDHGLKADLNAVAAAVRAWLSEILASNAVA
jgi:hypothetical protein